MNRAVLIFAAYGGPYEGNFVPSLRLLSRELKQRNLDVVLLLLEQVKDYSWVRGIDWCREIRFLGDNDRANIAALTRLMKENEFSFVYTHFAESKHIFLLKSAMVLAGRKIPVVDHLHARVKPLGNPAKQWIKNTLWRGDRLIGGADYCG